MPNAMPRSILGLCLLTLAGCDAPTGAPQQAPVPATADNASVGRAAAVTAATVAAQAPAGGADLVRQYGTCYAACFDEKSSATNRETCKLNCESVAEAAADALPGAPPKHMVMKSVATLHGCIDLCHEDAKLNATNRETCILTCQDAAEVGITAPPAAAPAP